LHAFLPVFPDDSVRVGAASFKPEDWKNEFTIPDAFDPRQFVQVVWPLLNPA
jgi:hypothetical protein